MTEKKGAGMSILDVEESHLTPGMKQYQDIKRAHPDCLVMLRMGDFYEMFYQDAVIAAKELEITLTARGKDQKRAPLAGVPYHALEGYLGKLIKKGYKVAIVEQLEDPKFAQGIVKRGLARIVTPGTVMEASLLNEKENNYVMTLNTSGEDYALAFCDISTGEFFTIPGSSQNSFWSEIARVNPRECIIPESLKVNSELIESLGKQGCFVNSLDDYYFRPENARQMLLSHFNLQSLDSLGLEGQKLNCSVAGALLYYVTTTQKNSLSYLKHISLRSSQHSMLLDSSTLRNLELLKNLGDGGSAGALLSVLDKTQTVMGSRRLKQWIQEPLLQTKRIGQRWEAIETLNKNIIAREEIITHLKLISDLERLISRINYGNASPRDMIALKISLQQIPKIKSFLEGLPGELLTLLGGMESLEETAMVLESAIKENPLLMIREGGIIKTGFSSELDELQDLKKNARMYLQKLEEQEKQKTGIQNLKVGYTQVFGYFIEVGKKHISVVPDYYIRKQTTANAERYITEELKVLEEKLLTVEDKINELEYSLFQNVIRQITTKTKAIQDAAGKIAVLDVLCSLSKVAVECNYVKPEITDRKVIHLQKSRHPVLEQQNHQFIANDILLNAKEMMLITGPNMSGKSTLMRQVALIVIMAQMGSFVPAEKAILGIVDRIFTRVGASDNISLGQSTFMVEMNETAFILHNATENSLIILDEIGRGTSTFDGVAIAWSVAEHILNKVKAKTMFSTHYHVLTKLAEKFPGVRNYNLAVKEQPGEILFLRRLIAGSTDRSYGIHVAQLAGLPFEVIERAKEIQDILQKDDDMMRKINVKKLQEQKGLGEF